MIPYDLGRLAKVSKPRTLPPLKDRKSMYYAYVRILRTMLEELLRASTALITHLLAREQVAIGTDHAMVHDIGPEDFGSLDALQRSLARIASNAVRRLLGLEAKLHTKTWRRDVDRVLGVDVSAVVRDEDLEAYLDAAATRNTNLIESLSQRQVARVKQIMLDAITRGQSVQDTRKQMVHEFEIGDSHAQLIARDQTAKLTSDLNRIRHEQAGVERYTWRTSLDERVRPRHRKLEGNVYEYGEATGAESGLPPGQPIQCRCIAQAIVDP